jgi:hypothetical protein
VKVTFISIGAPLYCDAGPQQGDTRIDLTDKLYLSVNGHWEIRLGGLVFSGLAATSFPGWWPRVLPAGGVRLPAGSPLSL